MSTKKERTMRPIMIRRGVWHTQAKGAWGLLHLGETAIFLLVKREDWPLAWGLEVATWYRWFRFRLYGQHADGRVRWSRGVETAQRRHR